MADENAPNPQAPPAAPIAPVRTDVGAERAIGTFRAAGSMADQADLAGREVRVRRAAEAGWSGEARQAQFHSEEESVPVLRGQVGLH